MDTRTHKRSQLKKIEHNGGGKICVSTLVPTIMQQQDVFSLLIELLDVQDLLVCSMVSKVFLRAIDSSKKSNFQQYLRFWCLSDASFPKDNDKELVFNHKTLEYEKEVALSCQWQRLWMRNIVTCKDALVQMRMPLSLSVNWENDDNVVVKGEEQTIAKLRKRKNLIVDVLEWKIRSVTFTDDHVYHLRAKNATVVMNVTQFLQSNKHITVKILRSIAVTFTHVPVFHTMLPPRVLCVLKCMQYCMYCKQRHVRFESFDHVDPEHRLLCSTCMDHLYVLHRQLQTKWKIKQNLCHKDSSNATEVRFFSTRSSCFAKRSNEGYLLKSKVALWLGYSDWSAFLKRNGAVASTDKFKNFYFNPRWL